ncbi:WEB family protein At2g17940 [Vitis riparia]|uniref:WEB family protein At2g17940 n=1 Tax=Vitis riparia TaxID=96939 RepID=UPI00155B081D|nr:WEB family protein At2g17940 [Vitis riparia]
MERAEGVVVMGRAEIDTRAPFRSVKEAVMLFGERVLAGELYANKLKEMRDRAGENAQVQSRYGAVTAELEETKQSLQKAREEGDLMVNCLRSLREELEETKRELIKLKSRNFDKQLVDPELEDLKFIENATKIEINTQTEDAEEFQKKRYVTFASPPSVTRIITNHDSSSEVQEKPPLQKKAKKKPLMPLMGWIFPRKKRSQDP